MKLTLNAVAALAVLALAAPAALAQDAAANTITGPAHALEPDIIMVGTQRVILLGIDAPERGQTCQDTTANTMWDCAGTAMSILDQLVQSGPVTCTLSGNPDVFGRRGGLCTVGGNDVGMQMVQQGYALAYDQDKEGASYHDAQQQAQTAKVGMWRAGITFMAPWDYRDEYHPGGFK